MRNVKSEDIFEYVAVGLRERKELEAEELLAFIPLEHVEVDLAPKMDDFQGVHHFDHARIAQV